MLGTYHLTALFDILNKVHFLYEPDKLWQYVLEQACRVLQSDAGTFYETSEDQQSLAVRAAYGINLERLSSFPFQVGTGVCGWVAKYQQPALVNDVRSDNRFNRQTDMITGFNTKSILCVPVFSMKRSYGVLEMINRKTGPFSPQDQEFMTLLGRQSAVAYQNLLLLSEIQHKEVLMQSLLSNLSGGLLAMDRQGMMTIINPAAIQLLQLNGEARPGRPVALVLKGHPWLMETLKKTLESQSVVSRQETMLTVAGVESRFGFTTILISDAAKTVMGSGIIFQRLS